MRLELHPEPEIATHRQSATWQISIGIDGRIMDKVFIEQLSVETVIGIYDWERKIRQKVVFDLDMDFDITQAAAQDAIEHTLDYKAVAKRVIAFVEASEFQLVETLAERVAAIILDEFSVTRLSLTLSKPGAVRGSKAVGVKIERSRAN